MSGTSQRKANLWRSAGLRLAGLFGFLVLITMLFTLSLVYIQVSAVLHRNVDRQLQQMQQRLAAKYANEGPEATAQTIRQVLQDGRDTDLELVLLTTPDGQFLAGNIDTTTLPLKPHADTGLRQLYRGSQSIDAQMVIHPLPDGAFLVLGHDLRELRSIESTVATASLVAGVFSLTLALAGGLIFRRELGRSVNALHQTITRIAGGHLHERVLLGEASTDEFVRLEQDFNHMLDRIEQLMDGVTQVSDEIAHNLRTPLTRLRLRLQEAHDTASTADALRDALQSAMQDIDDLSRVLEKLLSIAQAESGTRRAPFAPISWKAIGEDVVELYEDLAEHEGVSLLWQCEQPAPILGDRHLLAGALVNVVDNAIKYGGRGAQVQVRSCLRWQDGTCWSDIVVQDDGPGAPPEAIAVLGQRFLRFRPELPGHGLGLASVQAVMRLHGGSMQIEPASPGLRVTLRLPHSPSP